MAKKKRVAVDSAVQSIISGNNPATKRKTPEKNKPVATRLEFKDDDRLQVIADEMGIKKSEVIKLAILKFLKSWEKGDRPSKKTETVEVWDI